MTMILGKGVFFKMPGLLQRVSDLPNGYTAEWFAKYGFLEEQKYLWGTMIVVWLIDTSPQHSIYLVIYFHCISES